MHGPHWFRVELHTEDEIRALDRIADVFPHSSTLTPFLSWLLQVGIRHGHLVLIDERTGRMVARCPVRPQQRCVSRRQRLQGPRGR